MALQMPLPEIASGIGRNMRWLLQFVKSLVTKSNFKLVMLPNPDNHLLQLSLRPCLRFECILWMCYCLYCVNILIHSWLLSFFILPFLVKQSQVLSTVPHCFPTMPISDNFIPGFQCSRRGFIAFLPAKLFISVLGIALFSISIEIGFQMPRGSLQCDKSQRAQCNGTLPFEDIRNTTPIFMAKAKKCHPS